MDHADWPGARTVGLWPFGSKQRPSSHPQPHPIPLGCAFAANAHRGCCPGNLPPQERSGLRAPPTRRLQAPAAPLPDALAPVAPSSVACLSLGALSGHGHPGQEPGVQSRPLHGHRQPAEPRRPDSSCRTAPGSSYPGASDGEREGILLSGGGQIRAGALPREPQVTRGPSLILEKPPTSQARPLPSVGRGRRCARGKWRRRAGRS